MTLLTVCEMEMWGSTGTGVQRGQADKVVPGNDCGEDPRKREEAKEGQPGRLNTQLWAMPKTQTMMGQVVRDEDAAKSPCDDAQLQPLSRCPGDALGSSSPQVSLAGMLGPTWMAWKGR